MNTLLRIAFLSLAVVPALPAFAHEPATRTIQVTGMASTTTEPDLMRWNLELVTSGSEAEKVTADHSVLLNDTFRYLESIGVKREDVSASQLRINDETSYVESKLRQKDIVARINLVFKSTELNQYEKIWIGLGKLKGVRVTQVELDTSKRESLQNEVRLQALRSGKAKAEAMAGALGVAVKEPVSIRENGAAPFETGMAKVSFRAMNDGGNAQPLPGKIEISESAEIAFRIE